jgi:hypothetical protein
MSIRALANFNKNELLTFKTINTPDVPLFDIPRNECWKYILDDSQTGWFENLNISCIEELHDYIMTTQQCRCLDIIHTKIDFYIKNLLNNDHRDFIYFSKYLEAKEILENNITQDTLGKYTYTCGYANLMNIPLQESAKLIKTQYDTLATVLNEYELLRIEFKNLIVNEKDISNLQYILEKFFTQFEKYGRL